MIVFLLKSKEHFILDLINKTNHSGDALEDGYNTPYFETIR